MKIGPNYSQIENAPDAFQQNLKKKSYSYADYKEINQNNTEQSFMLGKTS